MNHFDHAHTHQQPFDMMRWIKAALLLGMGLYFLITILSGNMTNYINERFTWLSYIAVVLFFLFGAVAIWDILRSAPEHHHHDHDDHHHDHEHGGLSTSVALIVAIPLLLGTLVPSRPLGASAVDGNILTASVGLGEPLAFTRNPLERNILDWLREFNRAAAPSAFDGQPVDVVGFVYREPNFGEGRFMVARFTISCCVADAYALGIPVEATGTDDIADGTWVRVQGVLEAGLFNDNTLPIIRATSVEEVEQPEHPYLYS